MLKGLHIVGWPLLIGILAEAAWLAGWFDADERRLRRVLRAGLAVLHASVAAIVVYVVFAFLRPTYNEWVEWSVAAIAKGWLAGGQIYPDTAAPGKYTVFPYGPLLFQVVAGIYRLFGGSDRAVKAAFICLALLTYVLMFCVLRREFLGVRVSALAVEVLAVVVGIMGFMVKADILLVFVAVAACAVVAFVRSQLWMGLALAVLGGLAAAIKIHGGFYVLPAAVACLAMRPQRKGAKIFAAGVVAAGVAAAPFLVPGTSLANYVFILRTASQDGLLFGIFVSNLAFIGMCVAGVHVLVAPAARNRAYWRLIISVLVAGIFVSVFAAKSEAGPHHLVPLLPYMCLPLGRALQGRFDVRRAFLLVLFLVPFQPVTSVMGDVVLMLRHWGAATALI